MKATTGVRLKFGMGAVLGLLALAFAGAASAGCMMGALHQSAGSSPPDPSTFVPMVYRPGSMPGSFVKVDFGGPYDEGIVGLWEFKWNAPKPFGPDFGTQAWHSDGTEITFSGNQNPETGDVCQGVWRQIGRNTYTLNHIAMGWNAPGGEFGIRVHLHFIITLNPSGTAFSGKFTAAAYAVTAADPFDESTAPIATAAGTTTGVRVIPD
jgi:hypothetical protein